MWCRNAALPADQYPGQISIFMSGWIDCAISMIPHRAMHFAPIDDGATNPIVIAKRTIGEAVPP